MKHLILTLVLSFSISPLLADDLAPPPSDSNAPNNSISSATKPNFFPRLGLTDDQKAKVAEIRSSVKDPKERRQQVLSVLDNNQRRELRRMIRDWNRDHPRDNANEQDLGDQDPNAT